MDQHSERFICGGYGMAHFDAHWSGTVGADSDEPSGQRSQQDGSKGPFGCGGGKWTDVPEYNHSIEQQFAMWQAPGAVLGFVRALPHPCPRALLDEAMRTPSSVARRSSPGVSALLHRTRVPAPHPGWGPGVRCAALRCDASRCSCCWEESPDGFLAAAAAGEVFLMGFSQLAALQL